MEISDGQELALRSTAVHWEIARMLLDFVIPKGLDRVAPQRDDMVLGVVSRHLGVDAAS